MNCLYLSPARQTCYANDNDAFIPEKWAFESIKILTESMVITNLVHREFQNEIAEHGDVVNTRKVSKSEPKRKTDTDDYDDSDKTATNVQVKLDQWFYDSFRLKPREMSLSFKDLVREHLVESVKGIARGVDRAVLGRMAHALIKSPTTRSGRLLNLTSANAKDTILSARELLNKQLAYEDGRSMCLSPSSESAILAVPEFFKANESNKGSSIIEEARLGRILRFDTYMGQNVPSLTTAAVDVAAGTVTNALAAGGSGSQAVSIIGYEAVVGEYATVAGNDQPSFITAKTSGAGDTTAVTLNEANKFATLAAAVINVYKKFDVDGAYAIGYQKDITVDGHTASKGPQVGQIVSFGTGGTRHTYVIIKATVVTSTSTKILLDRPLDIALADNEDGFPGPAGSYNPAFHRDAFALVSRPMMKPGQNLGVNAAVATMNGLSIMVTMQWDINKGGVKVNLDLLAGIAELDKDLATLILG